MRIIVIFVILKRSLSRFGSNRNFAVFKNCFTSPCLLHVFRCHSLIVENKTDISSIINLYLEFSRRLRLVITDHSTRERNSKKLHRRNYRKWCDVFFFFCLVCARTQLCCVRNFTESDQQIDGNGVMWVWLHSLHCITAGRRIENNKFYCK